MNQDPTKRKLTAILSADVVGYSRLMEADEAWTIQSLEENKKLMSSLIKELNGRVVDSPGDNLLAEFNSVINAVECAVKIQNKLNNKNRYVIEERRMHFRIGVNLGDVVEEDGRIYGNGVNIASRLEGLAEPGGICISGTAYDHVIARLNLEYEYLGEHSVKNIDVPVRVYRIVIDTEAARKVVGEKRFFGKIGMASFITCIVATFVFTAFIVGAVLWILKKPEPTVPRQVMRFEYKLPEDQKFTTSSFTLPLLTVSPDGSKLLYSTTKGLFLRPMDELDGRFIDGTDGNSLNPFFSPDGQWIGFWSGNDQKLKKVATNGGTPVTLCDAGTNGGFSWSLDNRIFHGIGTNIMWVSENGGNWAPLIEHKDGLLGISQMLPGGDAVIYVNCATLPYKIMVQSLKTGERKKLLDGEFPQYLKTGHIVYIMENNLYSVPFDIDTLEITGDPVFLVEDVSKSGGYYHNYAISDSGTLVYIPELSSTDEQLNFVWVDREGKEEPLDIETNIINQNFKISPDGSRIVFGLYNSGNRDIWVWDIARKDRTRITFNPGVDNTPVWTPDGRKIIFSSVRESGSGVYCKASDGSGKEEMIDSKSELSAIYPASISSDGKILFFQTPGEGTFDIGMISLEESSEPISLLHEKSMEADPQISHDGKWLAYISDELGSVEIYVRPFPDMDSGGPWQVSTGGGNYPVWSPDGKELYYQGSDAMMAVSVETDPTFKPETPRSLFQIRNKYLGNFDIHPDDRRFLMLGIEKTAPRIIIVSNWFEELKVRVPVD